MAVTEDFDLEVVRKFSLRQNIDHLSVMRDDYIRADAHIASYPHS